MEVPLPPLPACKMSATSNWEDLHTAVQSLHSMMTQTVPKLQLSQHELSADVKEVLQKVPQQLPDLMDKQLHETRTCIDSPVTYL